MFADQIKAYLSTAKEHAARVETGAPLALQEATPPSTTADTTPIVDEVVPNEVVAPELTLPAREPLPAQEPGLAFQHDEQIVVPALEDPIVANEAPRTDAFGVCAPDLRRRAGAVSGRMTLAAES